MKYEMISDTNLDSQITSAIATRGKSNVVIQNVLISILIHVNKHGEPSKANKILTEMTESELVSQADTTSVRKYLEAFGKLTWDKDAKVLAFDKTKTTKLNETNGAKATMWWSFKPKSTKTDFDYEEEVSKVNKKALKQVAKRDELLAEGKATEALEIHVDLKKMQAVRLIMQGVVSADDILELASAKIKAA